MYLPNKIKMPTRFQVLGSVFSVIIMITVTWQCTFQKVGGVEGRPNGQFSNVAYRIENDDNETQDGVDLTVKGSILIEDGGKLTISNSILRIDSATDGLERIEIKQGGLLVVENSIIKANFSDKRYQFVVQGNLFINNSTVQDLYGLNKVGGIQIYTNGPVEIRNTTIQKALTSAIYIYKGIPVIDNVTIKDSGTGIYVYTPNGNPPEAAPSAVITIDEEVKRSNEYFDFSAASSTGTNLKYYWDFGDGTVDNAITPSHKFPAAGLYTVVLTVIDLHGRENKAQKSIHVLNGLPQAIATASPYSNGKNGNITFYGDKSTDCDGTINEYRWDFGDGTTSYGPVVKHRFATSGSHDVTLTVMDNTGDINQATVTVTITTNFAPQAEAGPDQLTFKDRSTPFSSTGSTDSDGTIQRYIWDYGDGSPKEVGAQKNHVYLIPGAFVATLTVVDDQGAMDQDTCVVVVNETAWPGLKSNIQRQGIADGLGPENANSVTFQFGMASTFVDGKLIDSGAITSNGMLFIGQGNIFSVYSFKDFAPIWFYPGIQNEFFETTPAVFGDYVIAISHVNVGGVVIYAFDATPADDPDEGYIDPPGIGYDIIWKYTTPVTSNTHSAPLISDGKVYLTISDSVTGQIALYIFDLDGLLDGQDGSSSDPVKKYDLYSTTNLCIGTAIHTPALSSGVIVVPVDDGPLNSVIAVNAATAAQLWCFPNAGNTLPYFALTPSICGDRVAVLQNNPGAAISTLFIFDLTPGDGVDEGIPDNHGTSLDIIAQTMLPISDYKGSMIFDGTYVYLTGPNIGSILYCYRLNPDNAMQQIDQIWNTIIADGTFVSGEVCLAGNILYVPCSTPIAGNVKAYSALSGALLFTYDSNRNYAPAMVAGGNLFVHSVGGNIYKIVRSDAIQWPIDYNETFIADVTGETGTITQVTSQEKTVQLKHSYYNPVVIVQPVSYQGSDPCHIRIKDVQSDSFKIFVEEWMYQQPDRSHPEEETVFYIVAEAGHYTLPGGIQLEAGKVTNLDENWHTQTFSSTMPVTPIVLTQSQTYNDANAIVTRTRNIGTDGFDVRLQEEQAAGDHDLETAGYIAITPGRGSNNGTIFEAIKTPIAVTDSWYTINFDCTYSQAPLFVAGMQTTQDSDPAGLRYKELSGSNVKVKVEEEKSFDEETTHGQESVGYFAFQQGCDIIREIPVAAIVLPPVYTPYVFYPGFNESMAFASSQAEIWRSGSGSQTLYTAQIYIRTAIVKIDIGNYVDAMDNARLAVNTISGIANWDQNVNGLYAVKIITNAMKNESYDKINSAQYSAGPANPDVISGWSQYNSGVTLLLNGQYSSAATCFKSTEISAITALGCLKPDLALHANKLTFSKYNPSLNEQFTIYAEIENDYLGTYLPGLATIRFYLGDPADKHQIGAEIPIDPPLHYLDTTTKSITYTPDKYGTFYIHAVIDENNHVFEMDETNNNASRPFIVTDGSVFPTLKFITFINNDKGVVTDGTPAISGNYLTLQNSWFESSTTYDIEVKNTAALQTKDTCFARNKIHIADSSSTLDKYWSLTMYTRNADSTRTIAANAAVAYTPKGEARQSNLYSDSNGRFDVWLKECQFTYSSSYPDNSQVTYKTPHLMEIDPNGGSNSKAYVMMDGPRSITIYKKESYALGGDADLDGCIDSVENKDGLFWMDAENHAFSKGQLVIDYNAFPVGANGTAVIPRSDKSIINKETFMDFQTGTYFIYMRAKYTELSGTPSAPTVDMIATAGVTDYSNTFTLSKDYKWYHLASVVLASAGTIKLNIKVNTADSSAQVRVDKLFFQSWKNGNSQEVIPLGQGSDPIEPDVDRDRAPDGLEIRSSSYWYEAEDFVNTNFGQVMDNNDASNGKEVKPISQAGQNFVSITVNVPDNTKTYLIYVKAKGDLKSLTIYTDGTNSYSITMTGTSVWYKKEVTFTAQSPHTITLRVPQLDDGIRVDSLHYDLKDKTVVDKLMKNGQQIPTPFDVSSASPYTCFAHVPDDSYVMSGNIQLSQTNMIFKTYNINIGAANRGTSPVIDDEFAIYLSIVVNNNCINVVEMTDDDDGVQGQPDIFGAGGSTSYRVTPLTVAAPSNPSISGHYLVYQLGGSIIFVDLYSDQNANQIRDYKEAVKPPGITLGAGSFPDISGDNVVWSNTGKIYWYDVKRGLSAITPVQISNGPGDNHPRISGDQVVYDNSNTNTVYLTQLSTWAFGYADPRLVVGAIQRMTVAANKVTLDLGAGLGGINKNPDIHGSFVVWEHDVGVGGASSIYLRDLRINSNPYDISGQQPTTMNTFPKVEGDKVVWIQSPVGTKQVMMFDLAEDSDNNGIPNYLELNQMATARTQLYVGTPVANADVYGYYVVWDQTATPVAKIARAFLGLNVGLAAPYTPSYTSTKFAMWKTSASTYNTNNLASAINEYLKLHWGGGSGGYIDVPLTFFTENAANVHVTISSVDVRSEFATDPMNNDTDKDGLSDGAEIVDYFGIDIIEAEDAMFAKEWKNPSLDEGKARIKDPVFIKQTGVTLTSSYNLIKSGVNGEGIRDSYITIPWRAPSSGNYRIKMLPTEGVSRVSDVLWLPRSYSQLSTPQQTPFLPGQITSYYPVQLQGADVSGVGKESAYFDRVVAAAVYIDIRESGGNKITALSEAKSGQIERVENGVLLGQGEDANKGLVSIHFSYSGDFVFTKNTNYEITLGIDLSRVSSADLNPAYPDNQLFTQLAMLRILDMDFFRVERQSLDPLSRDADGDGLTDGQEATETGFPLSKDADKDGLSDYEEIVTTHTNPMRRDSDFDGIRDGVELGKSPAYFQGMNTVTESFGSWTERICRWGTPFDYRPIHNYDEDWNAGQGNQIITDPLINDTDGDGIPDGWIDGWIYKHSPIDDSNKRTYQDSLNLQKTELRYDVTRWYNSGEVDNSVQIYEGEDLNCDGSRNAGGGATWDFKDDTLEPISNLLETNPMKHVLPGQPSDGADTDQDGIPDGYEVWFSAYYEPRHITNPNPPPNQFLLIDPTVQDAGSDLDSPMSQVLGTGPYGLKEMIGGAGNPIARAQRICFGSPAFPVTYAVIKQVWLHLDLSGDTDSKVTIELWDARLDYLCYGNPPPTSSVPTYELKPLVKGIEAVGCSDGWYTFDIPDNVFTVDPVNKVYYLVVRYVSNNGNSIGWHCGQPGPLGQYSVYQNAATLAWTKDPGQDRLYEIEFLCYGILGDDAKLLEEYIAGTNPKNPNTDCVEVGTHDKQGLRDDHLTDGVELGPNNAQGWATGGIIFRTNVERGAVSGANYDGTNSGQYIIYDPDGIGVPGQSQRWWTTKFTGSAKTPDPYTDNPGVDKENVLILTLDDGTEIYQLPDGDAANHFISSTLFIFPGGLNRDNTYHDESGKERIKCTMMTFAKSAVNHDLETAQVIDTYLDNGVSKYYIDKQLFLADPNNPDTDGDGIVDGLETYMGAVDSDLNGVIIQSEFDPSGKGWRVNTEENFNNVYDDGLINARDPDSDNDGLLDSQEVAYCLDSDIDGHANYADPDSDNDGLLDGQEVKPTEDTDGLDQLGNPGQAKTIYINLNGLPGQAVSGYSYDMKIDYNTGANILDKDSDNDGVCDGAEVNPFVLIDDKTPGQTTTLYSDASFLKDVTTPRGIAVGQDRSIYYGSMNTVYVLKNYNKFNQPEKNSPTRIAAYDGTILDTAIYQSAYLYANTGSKIYQHSLTSHATTKKTVTFSGQSISSLTVNSGGIVYVSSSLNKIYQIDFGPDKPTPSMVCQYTSSISDIAMDKNNNLLFIADNNIYLLKYPDYSVSSKIKLVSGGSQTLQYLTVDPSGAIYYSSKDTSVNPSLVYIDCLPSDYTLSSLKNQFIIQTVKSVKDVSGLDTGAQSDLVVANPNSGEILGFIGAASSPIKVDSDDDGLWDGMDLVGANPHKGELSTFNLDINHIGASKTTVTTARTFQTIADSDNDGITDGDERTGYSVIVTFMGSKPSVSVVTNPTEQDTDGDGLGDGIECKFSNGQERDSDQDGFFDAVEDANENGKVDSNESSPVVSDTDGEGLADGWQDYGQDGVPNSHDIYESDGIRQGTEILGEDFNFNGKHDANEPNPTMWDTDCDTISDYKEVQFLTNVNNNPHYTYNHDADNDGLPDVIESDADADGLPDNLENLNGDITYDSTESHPYVADSDGDHLPDGAEPCPRVDTDSDTYVNARDTDSNNNLVHDSGTDDYDKSYVVFRTTAVDSNKDGLLEYEGSSGYPKIWTYKSTSAYLGLDIYKYKYMETVSSLPSGNQKLTVRYSQSAGDYAPIVTPDQHNVYIYYQSSNGAYFIYIEFTKDGSTNYARYEEDGPTAGSKFVTQTWGHVNEVANHQITIDWRLAITSDYDLDGLDNAHDSNSLDRDCDDDGVMDGLDPNPTNADTDGDHLPDGLEMGVQIKIASIVVGTDNIDGTKVDSTTHIDWNYNGHNIEVPNFIADKDPSTTTDPKKTDTDGDGLDDNIEEIDMQNLFENHAFLDTDINGKFDGKYETNPLDKDTDNDGLVDGGIDRDGDGTVDYVEGEGEDLDHDGRVDVGGGNHLTVESRNNIGKINDWILVHVTETIPWMFDTDGDGLGDGVELGVTLQDIWSDTNTSIFIPDADTSLKTDPLNVDSDYDGVPDGWIDGWTSHSPSNGLYGVPDKEFQWGEGEDKNFNGKVDSGETSPKSVDSDTDGLLDGWDITSNDANQFPTIFKEDLGQGQNPRYRYWGELSYANHKLGQYDYGQGLVDHYQNGPTDPTLSDTDSDGLIDGLVADKDCELEYIVQGQTAYCDPSLFDSDTDGLGDGQEIRGWEVHILKEKTKEEVLSLSLIGANKPTSDPTKVFTDSDTVNDYNEFLSQANPRSTDTDGDHILDGDESPGELTQIEGKDPEILKDNGKQIKTDIGIKYDGWTGKIPVGLTIKVTVRVSDNAGLDYVKMKLANQPEQTKYFDNAPRTPSPVTLTFDFPWLDSLGGGYDIYVTVADVNGNGNKTKTHIEGIAEGIAKALIAAFWAFVEAVKKLATMVFEWIWNAFRSLMNNVFKPIIDGIQNFVSNILDKLTKYLNIGNGKSSDPNNSDLLINAILENPFIMILEIILTIINVILSIASPFILIVGTLLSGISDFVMKLIMNGLLGGCKNGKVADFSHDDPISNIMNNLLGISNTPSGRGNQNVENWLNEASLIIGSIGLIISLIVLAKKGSKAFWGLEGATVAVALISLFVSAFAGDNLGAELLGLGLGIASIILGGLAAANGIGLMDLIGDTLAVVGTAIAIVDVLNRT